MSPPSVSQVARRSPPIFWNVYHAFPQQSVQESLDELRRQIRFRVAPPSDDEGDEEEAGAGAGTREEAGGAPAAAEGL